MLAAPKVHTRRSEEPEILADRLNQLGASSSFCQRIHAYGSEVPPLFSQLAPKLDISQDDLLTSRSVKLPSITPRVQPERRSKKYAPNEELASKPNAEGAPFRQPSPRHGLQEHAPLEQMLASVDCSDSDEADTPSAGGPTCDPKITRKTERTASKQGTATETVGVDLLNGSSSLCSPRGTGLGSWRPKATRKGTVQENVASDIRKHLYGSREIRDRLCPPNTQSQATVCRLAVQKDAVPNTDPYAESLFQLADMARYRAERQLRSKELKRQERSNSKALQNWQQKREDEHAAQKQAQAETQEGHLRYQQKLNKFLEQKARRDVDRYVKEQRSREKAAEPGFGIC
ncbi:hypothetical protein CYMTET_22366 [Cymbomonas tetramitiformis]|uniref:Uncharacterized protein n=1 Tax=Cymbomonas tetramitiformis TaxID=36881 RepID=A0AAE0G055_9CHLO|nr:hypothetical protein CYMTET_22366 [Cymbomonas tetramitiformis]